MNQAQHKGWLAGNQRYLLAELERLHRLLDAYAGRAKEGADQTAAEEPAPAESAQEAAHAERLDAIVADMPAPPAMVELSQRFALTPFESDVLLLCAGAELNGEFYAACARASSGLLTPNFALALIVLPAAHFSAILPHEPLRRARLVRLQSGATLATSQLRIDERVLHYLLGLPAIDETLRSLLQDVPEPEALSLAQLDLVAQAKTLIAVERTKDTVSERAVVWLCGPDAASRRAIAATVCGQFKLSLCSLRAATVPQTHAEREELLTLWEREQQLCPVALLLCYDDQDSPEMLRAATSFLDRVEGVVLVSSREIPRTGERSVLRLDVPRPTQKEQVELWRASLGLNETSSGLPESAEALINQIASEFRLDTKAIRIASAQALGHDDKEDFAQALWRACRQQARPRLDELAQRIPSSAGWDDLVLPEAQRKLLRELVAQQRHQATVYYRWGFAGSSTRGLGVTALFVGQSGTGKTLSADVVANALNLDLYRIDLSQVISKYIGETEKNLRRVFDAAEEGGAVLLFDEADALFGKRTEVKDSHDRYANIEISYLLQRMEAYQGISILTSNMRSALDSAFLRRIRFIVDFPFPDLQQRAELWRRMMPSAAPQDNIVPEKLARLKVAGGHIRNIALGAAFLAADANQPVSMRHMLEAARAEYAKLDRPLTEAEIGGWV